MKKDDEKSLKAILESHLNKRTFTACALGVSFLGREGFSITEIFVGKTNRAKSAKAVDKETFFDVASLTKPLVTVLSLLALVKEKKIHFEEKLSTLLPFDIPDDKKHLRLKQLVNHRSGLPAHRKYYEKMRSNGNLKKSDVLINWILQEKLENKPGIKYVYSDLDYMLLGRIIEYKSGKSLQNYWKSKITDPLGISDRFFVEGENLNEKNVKFAVTGRCGWTDKPLEGRVNDDNCRALGRIQGHAGLFSTLDGIISLCNTILLNYCGLKEHPSYAGKDLRYLLKPRKREHWAYGFDVPTGQLSSSGKFFSAKTIGHLGYTGTSFWIDLEKRVAVVLLTNRVIFGTDNEKIRKMRPQLHDAIMEKVLKNKEFILR